MTLFVALLAQADEVAHLRHAPAAKRDSMMRLHFLSRTTLQALASVPLINSLGSCVPVKTSVPVAYDLDTTIATLADEGLLEDVGLVG